MGRFRAQSLPSAPLADAIMRIAEREHKRRAFAGSTAANDYRLTAICEQAEVPVRRVSSWRRGETNVSWGTADTVLTRLGLFWWEIWTEETVRVPLFEVRVYAHQWKTCHGKRRYQRIRTASVPYGDQGPDRETLRYVEHVMTGEVAA